ncbi:MAG: cytochrome c [Paracoccus sp. (in: a-proteobacteria)]|nr:cytochrome c [Paracoccus sp. (in: a-proteobacteria)]
MRQLILASLLAAVPVIGFADEAAENAIEAREGYMKMLEINMGTLAGMARGTIDYDPELAATAGNNLDALGQYAMLGLFAAGSGPQDGADTDALPSVWENSADFAAKYAAYTEAAAGAGETAGAGQDALGPLLQQLGGSCKACHDDYRKRN